MSAPTDLPRWAHIPGRTGEPDFDWLARLPKDTDARWPLGLILLAHGYAWEAHEALEPVWHALPPQSVGRDVVRAQIQLANACLKQTMGRPSAAKRLLAEINATLRPLVGVEAEARRGLNLVSLVQRCQTALADLETQGHFTETLVRDWCARAAHHLATCKKVQD